MTTPALTGLRQNWSQFILLVIINAFVGGMVGLERTMLPQLAESEFGIRSNTVILSFIVAFGLAKAVSNYAVGFWANRVGRKNLLVMGWGMAIPVPFLLMYATEWHWIVVANVLLGINQGLAWSSTVVMKMDLVGDRQRGLAAGINEFAGYLSVGLVAFLTSYLAAQYGIRPVPFYTGVVLTALGFTFSYFFVSDTARFVRQEAQHSTVPLLSHPFLDTTLRHRSLSAVTQAGLVNNLNDGMLWGLLPLLLLSRHFTATEIGLLAAIYPGVWGMAQLFTGPLSDRYPVRMILFTGMSLQALGIVALTKAGTFSEFVLISVGLGIGTALVYPTFMVAIAQFTNPQQRAESLGVFRLWRDLGYAIGALITGFITDRWGIESAILTVGGLTGLSGFITLFRMRPETDCIPAADVRHQLGERVGLTIIDVRSPEEYRQYHIPGSINIPLPRLAETRTLFKPGDRLITTSTVSGGRSVAGSRKLRSLGFKNVRWLCGGTSQWAI